MIFRRYQFSLCLVYTRLDSNTISLIIISFRLPQLQLIINDRQSLNSWILEILIELSLLNVNTTSSRLNATVVIDEMELLTPPEMLFVL